MKIEMLEGQVALLAQNVKESAQLLAVFHSSPEKEVAVAVVGAGRRKAGLSRGGKTVNRSNHRKGNNPWKFKHRRPCPDCGRLILNMTVHRMHKHLSKAPTVGDEVRPSL